MMLRLHIHVLLPHCARRTVVINAKCCFAAALGMWLSINSSSKVLFYTAQDRVCGHLCNCTITIDCLIIW